MFSKILIANRGEIAVRIMRTARRLGIRTAAVYSDADARAMHVAEADEAVRVGPPPAAQSYLDVEAIIDACRRTGAEAVHPGYGFLSENAAFVEAVTQAGLTFIGPSATSIRAMGLKDAAKALMEKAGVPVVPGYHGDEQDPAFLADAARRIGYPVLIKARAGGGGKGMRRVDGPEAFEAALAGARREAEASFGDGRVLIEKYLTKPRHIEVQVFGDTHGNVVHLFERDCSLQRRHQKVIEEAPAPGMMPAMRQTMGEAAVTAARAIEYHGAGTIEFIADVSDGLRPDRFYFMEMNTRLQVEHPVTEMIIGQDLVEWQLRVAAGEPLPLAQDELTIDGWSFEARLYAENVARGFLPATGTLETLQFAEGDAGVRIDTGVREGDAITPFYDPMIAKIIVHGETRDRALARLRSALGRCRIAGTVTNARFLLELARNRDFAAGNVDTGLIEREIESLTHPAPVPTAARVIAALAVLESEGHATALPARQGDPFATLGAWRLWDTPHAFTRLGEDGEVTDYQIAWPAPDRVEVTGGNLSATVAHFRMDGDDVRATIDSHTVSARVALGPRSVTVFLDGVQATFTRPDPLAGREVEGDGGDTIRAPMPGLVKFVNVATGDAVSKGAALIVMEAMKMEHTLTAPRDGTIAELAAKPGDQVDEAAVLLKLAPEA
jgi:3-methylcrotonyl-CoA carboxylase alpha subunit